MSYILQKRYNIIREIFGDVFYDRNSHEIICFCKEHKHHKRKLQINIQTGNYHCWVCGFGGKKIFYLLKKYATEMQRKQYLETLFSQHGGKETTIDVKLPDEYKFLLENKTTPAGKAAYSYLRDLDIDDDKIFICKIGICEYGKYKDRIIFPSFNNFGNLNFFSTRAIYDQNIKYIDCEAKKSGIIFNELFVNYKKPILITEGIKTYLKYFDSINIVSILGSSLNESYALFQEMVLNDIPGVFVGLDPDASKKALNIATRFYKYEIPTRVVDFPTQPDEMDKDSFLGCVINSENFSKDFALKKRIGNI